MLVAALALLPAGAADSNFPPAPAWKPNWNLTESTTINPSSADYFDTNFTWGLITLDWSVASNVWLRNGRDHTDVEATLTENCRRLKAAGKTQHCFMYHNMELALEVLETQRAVMYDPTKSHWFLQYTTNGTKNGTIYNANNSRGDQFFWDYTVPEAVDYVVRSTVQAMGSAVGPVDGCFLDDATGLPDEHRNAPAAMNLTSAQVSQQRAATAVAHSKLDAAMLAAGKFNTNMFSGQWFEAQRNCHMWMSSFCNSSNFASSAYFQEFSAGVNESQQVAAFLILRPAVAFIGWAFESDDRRCENGVCEIFKLQPGVPMGGCVEESAGVFTRQWSNGKVELDCDAYIAKLPFPKHP